MTDDPTRAPGNAGGHPPPFAARYGLVRPLQGRYVAGVGAALGRATNTDPVLWRVVLAVLVCFGGVRALIYLALWLAVPEEGDTGSPAEAMFGRGHSNTSPVLVMVLGVIAAVLLVFALTRPFDLVLLGGAVILAAVVLLNRSPGRPPAGYPVPPRPDAASPSAPAPVPPVAAAAEPPAPEPAAPGPAAAGTTGPAAAGTTGYRPPFSPHGPFGGPPPPPPLPPPTLLKPPRERSALPVLVLSAALVVLGALGGVDLAGMLDVPAAGYVAAALAVVGAGLVTGAWLGRARPLIALGVVLAVTLPVAHALDTWDREQPVATNITWAPTSVAELDDEYQLTFGEGRLDLRQVDFTGQDVELAVGVTGGEILVLLPPEVDVTAHADVFAGNATLFGEPVEGFGERSVTESGSPRADEGTLVIDVQVRFGDIEVRR